ncbi:MAG: addiction module antitoxin [Pseudomonadota bacterium]|nr:addiction module antitoxin [Gammaproteobacteria bacterium]MDQ3583673.1 addiction module antitoxin [Pseudomonadota bacterium]
MQKKLTISIDEAVYEGLHRVIGRRNISRFLEGLARPHILPAAIDEAYRQMVADEARETEAAEWVEGLVGDVADEAR